MNTYLINLFLVVFCISCGSGSVDNDSAATAVSCAAGEALKTTTVRGVVTPSSNAFENASVNAYFMRADGKADKGKHLGQGKTNKKGEYEIEIPQADLEPGTTIVLTASEITYQEAFTGEKVELTTPLNTLLPLEDKNLENGAVIEASITVLTEIAAQAAIKTAGQDAFEALKAASVLPVELEQAESFDEIAKDPALEDVFEETVQSNTEIEAFKDPDFKDKQAKNVTNSTFEVSQAVGLENIVATRPDDPAVGATSQETGNYMLILTAISEQASQVNTDSVAIAQAYAETLHTNGNFNTVGSEPVQVTSATGESVSILPPDFTQIDNLVENIATGVTTPVNTDFVVFAPASTEAVATEPTVEPSAESPVNNITPVSAFTWSSPVINTEPPKVAPPTFVPSAAVAKPAPLVDAAAGCV